jgi:hypothetical protein
MPNGLVEVSFGARGDTGRIALARLFREVSPDMQVSYRLLFDPLENAYMLNMRAVGLREGAAEGHAPPAAQATSSTSKWLDPARR